MNKNQNSTQRKLQSMYRQVETLVLELLDKITHIYYENGIRYFIKPTTDILMRLLTPYELKVYVDSDDIYCLFDKTTPNLQQNIKQLMRNDENSRKIEEEGKIPYLRQSKSSDVLLGLEKNGFGRKTKREKEKQIKQFNKIRIKQILTSQLLKWGKQQVKDGQIITRKRMSDKALQIGAKYQTKFGHRWLNRFITFDFQLRNLLTHGNSSDLKKNTNKQLSNKDNSHEIASQQIGDNNSSEYGIENQT